MEKLAAQFYTVREFTKNAKDFAKTCKRVKKIGYDGVQLSAIGPIPPKEIQKILSGEGLECVATHISFDRIEKGTNAVIDEHLMWGCRYPAIGGFFPQGGTGLKLKTWKDFVKRFNKCAALLAEAGLSLGYHNHFHEFLKLPDGLTCYEHLIRELDPFNAWFEIDTYWVAYAGKEPSALIRRLPHRVPCFHLKDGKLESRTDEFAPKLVITEVGDGNLEWPAIIDAAKFAGAQWYIVERDNGEMPPFESLEKSFHNLRDRMGL